MPELTITTKFCKVFSTGAYFSCSMVENEINKYLSTYDIDRIIGTDKVIIVTFIIRK